MKEMQENSWQRQLHLYEVPFYYIEYGFAQLGAIAVWKNYLEDKEKGLQLYKEALSAGLYSKYSRSICKKQVLSLILQVITLSPYLISLRKNLQN